MSLSKHSPSDVPTFGSGFSDHVRRLEDASDGDQLSKKDLLKLREGKAGAAHGAVEAVSLPQDETDAPASPERGLVVAAAGQVPREDRQAQPDPDPTFNIRKPMVRGLIIALMTFGGFGTWAMTAQLSSAVIASGSLTVLGSRKSVQHLEGGIVREILVQDGDRVRAGDVLVRLENVRAAAAHTIKRARYDAARAAIARLTAERDGLPQIDFPTDLLARAAQPDIAAILKAQSTAFKARREVLTGQESLIRQQIDQKRAEIRGLSAQVKARNRQLDLMRDELTGLQDLLRQGYVPRTRVIALERDMARTEGDLGETTAAIARALQSISEADLEIAQLRTSFRQEVIRDLRTHQQEAFDLENEVQAAGDMLTRTDIRAPAGGTVVALGVHSPGAVIDPGEVLMEIVPDTKSLVVEARVRPQDIDEVEAGQDADVRLSAFSARDRGKVRGTVTYVSADSMLDTRTQAPYFVAQVEIGEAQRAALEGTRLQPGMPADIFIKTGARTPFDFLISPLTDSIDRAWRED